MKVLTEQTPSRASSLPQRNGDKHEKAAASEEAAAF
jgi:hypothetical protein